MRDPPEALGEGTEVLAILVAEQGAVVSRLSSSFWAAASVKEFHSGRDVYY